MADPKPISKTDVAYAGLGSAALDSVLLNYTLAFGVPAFGTLTVYEESDPDTLIHFEEDSEGFLRVYNALAEDPLTAAGLAPTGTFVFELTVPTDEFVRTITNGNIYREETLKDLFTQLFIVAGSTAEGTLALPRAGDLDMGNNYIVNMLDGVNPTDAVTKGQLDVVAAAIVSGLLPDGTYGDIDVANSGSELNLRDGAVTASKINTGAANAGEVFIADGAGGGSYGEPASAVYNTYTERFTATAGQTTFTLSNTPALTTVWVNGAVQEGDTYARTGNDIILDTALDGGETVVVTYTTGIIGTVTGTLGSLTDVDSAGVTEGQVLKRGASGYEFGNPENASETVAGVVEMATLAQLQAGDTVGETGAPLVVPTSELSEVTLLENSFTGVSSIDIEPTFNDAVFKRGYKIFVEFTVSTNDARPDITMNYGAGYVSGSYEFYADGDNTAADVNARSTNSTTIRPCSTSGSQGINNASTTKAYLEITVPPNANATGVNKVIHGWLHAIITGGTYPMMYRFFGANTGQTDPLTGIRFAPSTGTITGNYIVKGLR